jgi:biopolymer transport protein TolR
MRGGEERDGLMADINVTPLVDVVLVLLIVFMITAPMLTTGIPVQLPVAGHKPPPQGPSTILQLTVDRDRIVYLDNEPIHPELLTERLRVLEEGAGGASVRVRADASVEYGFVVSVLDAVRRSGISDVHLVTRPTPTEEP